MIFQLSFAQKIIIISFLDQKLCQFEIWSIPCYWVIFNVIICIFILAAFPAENAAKMNNVLEMLKIPNFCDYLIDAASGESRERRK